MIVGCLLVFVYMLHGFARNVGGALVSLCSLIFKSYDVLLRGVDD